MDDRISNLDWDIDYYLRLFVGLLWPSRQINNNNNNNNKLQLGYHSVAVVIRKKKVTREFKSGRLHERHVVATWKLGNHLSIRL